MGSSPTSATRPVGQEVKTPPFHGSNGGSIPPRVTKTKSKSKDLLFCFDCPYLTGESKGCAYVGTTGKNSPGEHYEGGIRCYFLVFCGVFPCFSYDMVTAVRCPRTGIVPQNSAIVKRAFCSVSWQTGGASLRSAERVEQQSSKQGAAEDSCPLYWCL